MDFTRVSQIMLKLFTILLLPSLCFAYPELVSKSCASCHTEASGSGLLTNNGKTFALNSAYQKTESYFEIKTPDWLLLGAKADAKQAFTKTPYEETGSFKATRVEAQVGLNDMIDTYLNISAQGSVNRVEPKTKSDSISDYVYYPYRFLEVRYSDSPEESLAAKYGFYRNEWQNDFSLFETSYQQTEFIFSHENHQVSLGYIDQAKTYNTSSDVNDGFINYKYYKSEHYSILLGHQWGDQYQLYSLGFIAKKSEALTFKASISESITSGVKGIQARLSPVYQLNSYFKIHGFAGYENTNIKTAQPRIIVYGAGADFLWFSQGLLSAVYSNTDDSNLINNPTEKLELNFHLYM